MAKRGTYLGLKVHPDAKLFPLMKGKAFEELKESIRKRGLQEPIKLHDGMILDGRNRARALAALSGPAVQVGKHGRLRPAGKDAPKGVVAEPAVLDGMIPAEYVAATNVHRRQLTTRQRAAIGAELLQLIKKERAGSNDPKGRSADIAAKAMRVSPASVTRAAKVMRENPTEHERAKRGVSTGKSASLAHVVAQDEERAEKIEDVGWQAIRAPWRGKKTIVRLSRALSDLARINTTKTERTEPPKVTEDIVSRLREWTFD